MAKKIQINKNRSGAEAQPEASIYDSTIDLPQDFGVIPTSGIVQHEDGSLEVSNIRIHRVGLEFVGEVDEEEYEIFGQTLLQIDTAYQWIVGDYLAYGVENNYGMAKDFAEKLGKSEQTITNWVYVSRHIEFYRRRENLSHGHHDAVAGLSNDEQKYWLDLAEKGNGKQGKEQKIWSVKKLRDEISKTRDTLEVDKPSPATRLLERWQKMVNPKKWKKLSPTERTKLKTALEKMLDDIDTWENS